MSELLFNVKEIIKKLKDILKCDICNNLFDFNNHIPLITSSGETFCKQCLSENKKKFKEWINTKKNNNLEVDLSGFNFIENIKIEIILKDIINFYDKIISEKFIVFSKQLTERNNNQRVGHYLLTYNTSSTALKENASNDYIYDGSTKKICMKKSLNNTKNSNNNLNNNNLNKNEKIEKYDSHTADNSENKYKIISKEINLKNSANSINNNKISLKTSNINNFNISDIDDNLNTMVFNDEINHFFEEKDDEMKVIGDDSIETIPINEEKSNVNISFKKEFNELWAKNDEVKGETIKQNEIKNDLNKYVFINKNNLIYKNNQKISCSTLNIAKKKEVKTKNKKENKFIYQLSEPTFDNININNLNNKCNEGEKKINNNKEKEKFSFIKINENEKIKKIYSNSNYYEFGNKHSFKNISKNDTNYIINHLNNNETKKGKDFFKKNINKYQASPRQIMTKEIKRKIEEDEKEDNYFNDKNLTTIKSNNKQKKHKDKNILFDEDEIKIVVKDFNNGYYNEESQNNIMKFNYNENNTYKIKKISSIEKNKEEKNHKIRYTTNNSKIKHTITYNRKILGKSNFSPSKNNSTENLEKKNINKYEYFKKINKNSLANKAEFRTISQSKKKDNIINNNISTNEIIRSTRKDRIYESINNYNQNNIKCVPKITSIYLKFDNQKKNHFMKKNINNNKFYQNNSNSSDYNNNDYDDNNEDKSNVLDEKNISIKKTKTFLNKTKDELDNLKTSDKINSNNKEKRNSNSIPKKNDLEIKSNEFNKYFQEKINKEKNIKIKKNLIKNKTKYEEIIKSSLNCSLFSNSFDNIEMLFLPNNDFFVGILSPKNLPEKGILYSLDGNYYEGTFLNGNKEGKGLIIYKNGAKYEGEIKNNLHNGVGKLSQLDGEVFIGEWKEGKINGNGVRYHNNGDIYSGHYVNSIRDGSGKYIFANGDSYEGKWKNGKANGKGIYRFKNGNTYEGEFENNNFCGQGCFKKKKGDIYYGEFKNGVLNGEGTIITKDKDKFIGIFKDGKKHGKGILYDKDGNIIKSGIWESNKYVSEE